MSDLVSIIIPCRNEEGFIGEVLDNVAAQDYPTDLIEVWVVDAMSTDKTQEIVHEHSKKHQNVHLLENPDITVPYALNAGIRSSTGDLIIILGAHSTYPVNYVSKLVYWVRKLDADNVGGLWQTLPSADTTIARANAVALSHMFGVGNAYYRIGANKNIEVDTVPFGCYPKEVFDRIGYFDNQFARNEDDELNGRLKNQGGKIVLIPEIKFGYFARSSLNKLWKMLYNYGYYKPLVTIRLNRPTSLRQFAPLLFVTTLIGVLILSILDLQWLTLFVFIMGVYLAVSVAMSIPAGRKHGLDVIMVLPLVFLTMHLSYGIGYLAGIINFFIFRKGFKKKTA